ncbi:hypothetical protein [Rummeliibacillus pycnus]|uniref:hypothetical protein n=1 Tax=Rummeliibacillus pycnus TaxID=101070 RepID=UPI003D2C257D
MIMTEKQLIDTDILNEFMGMNFDIIRRNSKTNERSFYFYCKETGDFVGEVDLDSCKMTEQFEKLIPKAKVISLRSLLLKN